LFELEIGGHVYGFKFGIGFLREIDRAVKAGVPGLNGVEKPMGFRFYFSSFLDGDVQALEKILLTGNAGMQPRLTIPVLDEWVDDPDTDLDQVMADVKDFLLRSNACGGQAKRMIAEIQKELEKAAK